MIKNIIVSAESGSPRIEEDILMEKTIFTPGLIAEPKDPFVLECIKPTMSYEIPFFNSQKDLGYKSQKRKRNHRYITWIELIIKIWKQVK